MYHLIDAYLLSVFVATLGAYLGALLFGAAAVPRVILNALDEKMAGTVLRAYWPRYHKVAVVLGALLTGALVIVIPVDSLPAIYSLLLTSLAAFMTLCFFVGMRLIERINTARDSGDTETFNRLHRNDIVLVALGLVFGISLMGAVIYVLPGQFTFWQ